MKECRPWLSLTLVVFCLSLTAVWAGDSGPQYTASEYKAYMKVHTAATPDEKEAALFEFLNWNNQSSLMPNVLYELQLYLEERIKNNEADKAEAVAKQLLANYAVAKEVAERIMARICLERKQFDCYLDYAEMIFNRSPMAKAAAEMAVVAAKARLADRCDKYIAIVEGKGSSQEKADLYFTLSRNCSEEKDEANALAYARKVVAVLDVPEKPADFTGDWAAYQTQVLNPSLGLIGMAHYNANEFQPAIDVFNKILQRDPKEILTIYYRGAAFNGLGDTEKALTDFAFVVALNDPKVSQNALETMRRILTKKGEDPAKAEEYVNKAKASLGVQ